MNQWFEVDKNGLRSLQAGKKKTFIINELVQNAWDENITTCNINILYKNGLMTINIEDDNPEGFKDITHAYTLFADTYKRRDPTKRGRFNLGEKQVISICSYAMVSTTKGTIIFDRQGRHNSSKKRNSGSIITVKFRASKKEFDELILHTQLLIPPKHIKFIVNKKTIPYKSIFKSFKCKLITEILDNEIMKTSLRETIVNLIKGNGQSWIYEMGIPIIKTDCDWHIDVQQKIPLAIDRETIRQSFLQDLYAEILNHTYDDIIEDNISAMWVRTGSKDKRIGKNAIQMILTKRFGDKFLSRNPFDPVANDDAISYGYNLIHGSEMSKEEWDRAKDFDLIKSTTDEFGKIGVAGKIIIPTQNQQRFANFVKKIAKHFLNIDIDINFVRSNASCGAEYGNRILTFNLSKLPSTFFANGITRENLDLVIHELGHEKGMHTEIEYHKLLTKLGAGLVIKALKEPSFFEISKDA